MSEILDIHTHKKAPQPEAIVSIRLGHDNQPELDTDDQLYSIGIHPWDIPASVAPEMWETLEKYAASPFVAAIGECGVDLKCGVPMFRQLEVFKHHIEISERLRKPLVIHDVKGDDIVCGLRRDLHPSQPWCIHGFRGKPAAAAALLRAGCYLSFGEKFNPDSVKVIPSDRILAETDESKLSINRIISNISAVREEDLTGIIKVNSKKFCNFVG